MKPFHFRLERLQRVRRTQERIERERWAAAEARAQEAARRADLAAGAFQQGLAEVRRAQGQGPLQPSQVLHSQAALTRLATFVARERALADQRRAEAQAVRAPWLARRAEVEGLERLRARERLSHDRDGERVQAQEMDETAGALAARARRTAARCPAGDANGRSHPRSPDCP